MRRLYLNLEKVYAKLERISRLESLASVSGTGVANIFYRLSVGSIIEVDTWLICIPGRYKFPRR